MKVNGTNSVNFNPYKNALQKQMQLKRENNRQDQVEISTEAKQLQEIEKPKEFRSQYVHGLKQAVESGEYKVDPLKTAEKMLEFWSQK